MDQATVIMRGSKGPGRPEQSGAGRLRGTSTASSRLNEGLERGELAQRSIGPRLLDLDAAAAYLSVSPWTVRDLEAAGVLLRVRVPLPDGRELRKLLFDKADLDRLIGRWKDTPA
jgi:hypothetical protein